MRVTTPLIYQLGVEAIARQQEALLRTQQQIASGRRILVPSDDPIGAAQAMALTHANATTMQQATNIAAAGEALGYAEGILAEVTNLLQSSRTLAVNAGNGTLSDGDRRALATELRAQLDHLVGLANTRDGDGSYVFAGFATTTQPFGRTSGGVAYNGDQGVRTLEVAPGRSLPISASGDAVFMRIRTGNGTFTTSAAATNAGTGQIDAGTVVNPGALTGHAYELQFSVVGGVTTYDVIDTTTSTTVSSGNAFTDGAAITVAGMQVTLKGAPAAGDRFALAPSGTQSVFDTLDGLIATLESPGGTAAARAAIANGVGAGLANLDQALEQLLTARAGMGAGLRELDGLATGNEAVQLQQDGTLSRLQDLDYNAALSDFARQQLALEAAQKSFLQVTGLSLFDYL
ncbi:MAG TPA: flagellar hook-associated protein FlgL [Casimicrobiaceae bacterium]|nr:flagellar hook-associated protein FlgL [Casimicrobiaceae bacterium]